MGFVAWRGVEVFVDAAFGGVHVAEGGADGRGMGCGENWDMR